MKRLGRALAWGLGGVSPQTSASLPGFALLASSLKTVIFSALTLCARHFLFKIASWHRLLTPFYRQESQASEKFYPSYSRSHSSKVAGLRFLPRVWRDPNPTLTYARKDLGKSQWTDKKSLCKFFHRSTPPPRHRRFENIFSKMALYVPCFVSGGTSDFHDFFFSFLHWKCIAFINLKEPKSICYCKIEY